MTTLDTIISQLLSAKMHSRVLSRTIDVCKEQECSTIDIESPVSVRAWLADGLQGWHISLMDGHEYFADYVRVVELDADGMPVETKSIRDLGRSFSELA